MMLASPLNRVSSQRRKSSAIALPILPVADYARRVAISSRLRALAGTEVRLPSSGASRMFQKWDRDNTPSPIVLGQMTHTTLFHKHQVLERPTESLRVMTVLPQTSRVSQRRLQYFVNRTTHNDLR